MLLQGCLYAAAGYPDTLLQQIARLLHPSASCTAAGSLSSRRILVQMFNVQTLFALMSSLDFNLVSDQSAKKRFEICIGQVTAKIQVCINTLV